MLINLIDFYALSFLVCADTFDLQDKKSLELGPEDNLYLEGFALNVFGKADKQDRAGRADLLVHFPIHLCIFFENCVDFFMPLCEHSLSSQSFYWAPISYLFAMFYIFIWKLIII